MARPSYIFVEGFWERLDDEIYKKNRTKKDLAKQCGFDRKILIRHSGHDNICLPYFARICSALNVSSDYLLFGQNNISDK